MRTLLEHGANSNIVDHNGSSPLHLASWTGDYEIVDILIGPTGNGCADINLKVGQWAFVADRFDDIPLLLSPIPFKEQRQRNPSSFVVSVRPYCCRLAAAHQRSRPVRGEHQVGDALRPGLPVRPTGNGGAVVGNAL